MAQRVQITLVDDLDETGKTEASETVKFSWGGKDYEIDLSDRNAKKFHSVVEPYVEHSRVVRGGRGGRKSAASSGSNHDSAAIRQWAQSQGMSVNPRGQVPKEVREAYAAAH